MNQVGVRVMKSNYSRGMTLVEVLIVVVVIGMLSALLIPAINFSIQSRENAKAASKLRTAVAAFTMYRSEMGRYPADKNPGQTPPEMTDYFREFNIDDWWSDPTELGGGWDWDNGYHYKYSVSISAPTKSSSQLTDFDRLVDDGNLDTGKFRKYGTQYHYIIEQ